MNKQNDIDELQRLIVQCRKVRKAMLITMYVMVFLAVLNLLAFIRNFI